MPQKSNTAIAVVGIDIGENSFHVVGHDAQGAIVLPCLAFSPRAPTCCRRGCCASSRRWRSTGAGSLSA